MEMKKMKITPPFVLVDEAAVNKMFGRFEIPNSLRQFERGGRVIENKGDNPKILFD